MLRGIPTMRSLQEWSSRNRCGKKSGASGGQEFSSIQMTCLVTRVCLVLAHYDSSKGKILQARNEDAGEDGPVHYTPGKRRQGAKLWVGSLGRAEALNRGNRSCHRERALRRHLLILHGVHEHLHGLPGVRRRAYRGNQQTAAHPRLSGLRNAVAA